MTHPPPITGRAQGHDIDENKVVNLAKYQPQQLSLFQRFLPDEDRYSNTIEFYDAIPKYYTNKQKIGDKREGAAGRKFYLPTLERQFEYKNTLYSLEIDPARVRDNDGIKKDFYPSEQEELVEEALRKLAAHRLNGVFLEGAAGVQFTMYELEAELRKRNHTMSQTQLKRSLMIGRRTGLCVKHSRGGESLLDTNIFPVVMISKRHKYIEDPKGTRCYVQFNPLITKSLNELTYRQFDYITFMEYDRQLSRWFHKRLYHRFTNAGLLETYNILYSTVKRDSGLLNNQRSSQDIKYLEKTLEELKDKNIIVNYSKEVRRGARNRIVDVLYILHPHPLFISEIKKANKRVTTAMASAPILLDAHREK